MVALEAVVARVREEPIDGVGVGPLRDDVGALRRVIDQLEAECTRRLARLGAAVGGDGDAATMSWLRRDCALSAGAASQRLVVARQLQEMPVAAEAFSRGAIGFDHAAVLARVVSDFGPEAARAAESQLMEAATRVDPSQLRTIAKNLRTLADPKGVLAQTIADHDRRRLHMCETFDGVYALEGTLDAEGGAVVRTALDSLSMPFPDDRRTAAQRRADALVELATRMLQAGELPVTRGERPHVVLTTCSDGLGGRGERAPEVEFAGAVCAETAQRIACDATVSEVTVDTAGNPLSVGRTRRTQRSADQRRASRCMAAAPPQQRATLSGGSRTSTPLSPLRTQVSPDPRPTSESTCATR